MLPFGFVNAPQYLLIHFIQTFKQFIQELLNALWEAMLQHFQLAEYPSKPEE